MKKKLLCALLLASPFLAAAEPHPPIDRPPLAEAGPRGPFPEPPGGPGEDGPLPPFLRGVNLSEQQRDRLFELHWREQPALRKLRQEARRAREALHELSQAEKFDEAAARRLSEQLAQAESRLLLSQSRLEQQAYAVLTPEQRDACGKNRR